MEDADIQARLTNETAAYDEGAAPSDALDLDDQVDDQVVISLLLSGQVTTNQVRKAIALRQDDAKRALWRILADDPDLDQDVVFDEAARVYTFDKVQVPYPAAVAFLRECRDAFTEEQWEQMIALGVLPLARETMNDQTRWFFAAYDPLDRDVPRLIESLGVTAYHLGYYPASAMKVIIEHVFPPRNKYLEHLQNGARTDLDLIEQGLDLIDEGEIESQIKQSALLALFEALLIEAVRQKASDIHIRPNAHGHLDIRFRVDGQLKTWYTEKGVHPEAFLAVVKDNARGVDRFEREKAQDGSLQRTIDNAHIRFRVSVLPMTGTDYRHRLESIVLRILDDRNTPKGFSDLGLDAIALQRFEEAIAQPYGLVVVTGPTGSGKSTTLYAALRTVTTPAVNVLTVEDPVEYVIPNIVQIKLSHKLGIENALRAILRHDPDIVMVGEMRDQVTAELAIKLANTGHLAFSTLHTNDAASAITRLYKMGIEPFLIAYAINLVVAQRLIRNLCPACKKPVKTVNRLLLERLGFSEEEVAETTFFAPSYAPCKTCGGQGYRGRRAIAEVLPFSESIRRHIMETGQDINEEVLRGIARAEGLPTLGRAALDLVTTGVTSIEEARRLIFLQ